MQPKFETGENGRKIQRVIEIFSKSQMSYGRGKFSRQRLIKVNSKFEMSKLWGKEVEGRIEVVPEGQVRNLGREVIYRLIEILNIIINTMKIETNIPSENCSCVQESGMLDSI